jgi:predicted nucleic acid-binding protein
MLMKSSKRSAVSERWILNASPLIVLARLGYKDLFSKLADQVVIPQAVATEILAGPEEDQARRAVEAKQFAIVDAPPPPAEILAWDLGDGEAEVLSLALSEAGWTAILDDAAARKCAQSFSVPIKGTLAVVILAKQRGLIPSAAQVLRALRASGFRLDDAIIHQVLARTVGENWSPERHS